MSLGAIGDLNNDGYLDIANNNKIFMLFQMGIIGLKSPCRVFKAIETE